jgi:apolipoprotein N-acyltransferase
VNWNALSQKGPEDAKSRVSIGLLWIFVVGLGSVIWLPLNWDRYFFPMAACTVLLEAALIGILCRLPRAIQRARSASDYV